MLHIRLLGASHTASIAAASLVGASIMGRREWFFDLLQEHVNGAALCSWLGVLAAVPRTPTSIMLRCIQQELHRGGPSGAVVRG